MIKEKWTKEKAMPEIETLGQYIKCCVVESMIDDLRNNSLNKEKAIEIAAMMEAMGLVESG